ncbi:MAG: hypothetical protein U0166_24435 [Acidobacteriota bacterium]
MPIATSKRTEIQQLLARLAAPDPDGASAAAARLLVIGSPAFPSICEALGAAEELQALRLLRLLGLLKDRRVIPVLEGAAGARRGARSILAIKVLASYEKPAAVRALAGLVPAAGPPELAAIAVSLARLQRAGVSGASEANVSAQEGAMLTPVALERAGGELDELLADLGDMRVAADASQQRAPSDAAPSLDAYLAFVPESPEELRHRRAVARVTPVSTLARRLELESEPVRLGLLALLATEVKDAALIPPLWEVCKRAGEALHARPRDRQEVVALSARAHLALASQESRVAAVELRELLSTLRDELRVEHLHAAEAIGGKAELPALAALCATPGWLGDAAFRVLRAIAGREGISWRSAQLRALPPGRKSELRRVAK